MSDRYIEKSLLYLLIISFLLHVGVAAVLYYLPQPPAPPAKEPVFVDLQQMPEFKIPEQLRQQETQRQSERRIRVPLETAPQGRDAIDNTAAPPSSMQPPRQRDQTPPVPRAIPVTPGSSASALLKPK